jgi:hypothetical protein
MSRVNTYAKPSLGWPGSCLAGYIHSLSHTKLCPLVSDRPNKSVHMGPPSFQLRAPLLKLTKLHRLKATKSQWLVLLHYPLFSQALSRRL